jgi:hypothetical protein
MKTNANGWRMVLVAGLVAAVGSGVALAQATPGGGMAAPEASTFTLFGTPALKLSGEKAFVAPVTSPYWNENSLITTDVRGWYAFHKFNSDTPLGSDSNASVYALQLRLALTHNLQFVAYKDGYVDFDGSVISSEGTNDIGAGLKWQWLRLEAEQLYAAVGAGYELRFGESRALQNDAEARVWASVDKGFGPLHLGATINGRYSTSGKNSDNGNSHMLSWHLRADYRVSEIFSPVVEFNGYHIISEGDAGLPLNGADVANFGGKDADATITGAVGAELRAGANTAIRAAYELPVTDNEDSLFGTRLTFSIIYSF